MGEKFVDELVNKIDGVLEKWSAGVGVGQWSSACHNKEEW